MEINLTYFDKFELEQIELYHYLFDLNAEKMNVGEEIRSKEINRSS